MGISQEAPSDNKASTQSIVPNGLGPDQKFLCLVGVGVKHSIAPPMHNYIASALDKPWEFSSIECPTVEEAMTLFRSPSFAGAVVTMPYKKTIMPLLDGLDELATVLGACNNVYIAADGKLRGTNTDWRGVKGCLLNASSPRAGSPAMIIGAGGASRAAVYALFAELNCDTIYIVNRDDQEVADLLKDSESYSGQRKPNLVHLKSVAQAQGLPVPFYIVGTVPDFEPKTPHELEARAILEEFLSRDQGPKGVLLDMCFKPRKTRILALGKKYGWNLVEGTEIIGHQIQEQWRLWTGEEVIGNSLAEGAWKVLRKQAEESTSINF